MTSSFHQYVIGKCQEMCPLEEQKMRRQKKLVHPLEKGNDMVMVKCFTRSAAGIEVAKSLNIRPPAILLSTIYYLFNRVLSDKDYKYRIIYDFIDDRLKSIKQDLFIQQPCAEECIQILEPIVRFYAYSAYRLGMENIKYFDPKLNYNQLLESLKWLLNEYNNMDDYISEARIEMESLYVILNLGEPEILMRSISLRSLRTDLIIKCENLSKSWYLGNYVQVLKEVNKLPLLHLTIFCTYQLSHIRRYVLNVLNSAYSSKNLTVPLDYLKSLLLYNNEFEVIEDCHLYGIEVIEDDSQIKKIHFNKSSWNPKYQISKLFQLDEVDEKLKTSFTPDSLLSSYNLTN